MSYPPKHHQEQSFENILRTIAAYPLASLITAENSQPMVSHVPLIFENTANGLGKLIGHMDKNNPQVAYLQKGHICVIVFNGPQTYISPNIYSTKQLPTYNYIKVHIEGTPVIIKDNEKVKSSIIKMTEALEGSQPQYVLKPDDSRMAALVDFIVGFEITITSWEGKYKLSQDKLDVDQEAAKHALTASEPVYRTNYINAIYENHVMLK